MTIETEISRIGRLAEAVRKAREGDFSFDIETSGESDELDNLAVEIRLLVGAFQEQVSERNRAEEALRVSEKNSREIFESSPVGIFRSSIEGKFICANPAVARILKYDSPEEMIRLVNQTSIADAVYVDPLRRREIVACAQSRISWKVYEEQFRCKNGSIVTCNFHFRALPKVGDSDWEFEGFVVDTTEQKRADQALQGSNDLLRAVIEAAPTAIIGLDLDGNVRDVWNPAAEKMLGWRADEVMGRPLPSVPLESQDEFRRFREWIRSGKTMNGVEVSRRRRDGSLVDYSIYASPLHDREGNITGNIAVLVDISERKRADEKLRVSENRFRMIVETAEEGIWQVDGDWNTIYANRRMEQMLGCEPGSIQGLNIREFMDDEGCRAVAELILRREEGIHEIHDFRFVRRDGSHLDALVCATPLIDEQGKFVGSFAMVTDITERKLAENALRLSQFIIDKVSLGIFQGGSDGRILSVNEYWAGLLGYTPEELCTMSFFDIDPNLTQEIWREHRKILAATGYNTFESVHRRKDGTTFPVEITVNYLKFQDREFSCSFAKDITERKVQEEALRQANLIVENSPAVLFRWRAEEGWPVEMVSGNVARFGYAPEEFLAGAIPFFSIIYPEDQERVVAEVRDYSAGGANNFQQEYRIVTKGEDVRWIEDRTAVERDADGRITHFQGIVIDITDRKRTENVIAARIRLLQFAAMHTLDELLEATLNEVEELTGSCIGFYHYLEPDQQTLRLQNWSTRTKKEFCTALGKGLHYDVSSAGVWVDCIRERRPVIHNDYASLPHRKGLPSGHPPVVRELVVPVFSGESIVAILGVGNKPRDYTLQDVEMVSLLAGLAWEIVERKRAEEALKISERKYRSIIEHAPFGICRSTIEGKLVSANPAMAGILKYESPEDLLENVNRSSIQKVLFVEPSEREQVVDRIFEGSAWYVFDCRYRCKDGSIITCKVHSRRILEQEGCEREFESFLENITDRLEAEKAMRESEEKFRVLAETAPAAIVVYQDENFVYVNPAAVRLFGYNEAELLRMRFWEWAHPEDRAMIKERGMARQRGETVPVQYEHRFIHKSGEEGWVVVSAGAITYRGNPAGIATFIDITENRLVTERMQSALAEKVVLLKEVHHRVKNNLQIISSLLELQSDQIQGDASRKFIRESQDRIRSMAIVHEQLYKSEDLAMIDFARYVDELVSSLYRSFVRSADKITTDIEVSDIELGIDEAISCGLIVNELVSNALKHAFPAERGGNILIRGFLDEEDQVSLTVIDNGVGLPKDFDIATSESLGLQIVTLLTKQLQGTFEIRGDNGTTVSIRFKSKQSR